MAKSALPAANAVMRQQTIKDEMPLKGPAITRPQPPPKTLSKRSVSRVMRGRR